MDRHTLADAVHQLIALRVPLLAAAFMVGFPVLALTKARSLFLGLFDHTPGSLLLATIAAFSMAATTGTIVHLVQLQYSGPHLIIWLAHLLPDPFVGYRVLYVGAILLLTMPTVIAAISVSRRQNRSLVSLVGAAVLGLALGGAAAWLLMVSVFVPLHRMAPHPLNPLAAWILRVAAGGEWNIYTQHLFAACAFAVTLVVWAAFGLYGYFALGKPKTVPALASLLMLVMMLTWILGAMTYYLDHYGIPALLIVVLVGALNALCPWSDHTYQLIDPVQVPEPNPAEVLTATKSKAVIVVAAEGGGIQAAAWTAQVLEGLHDRFGKSFDDALRMISGVSGGSVGTACYMDWLQDPDATKNPSEAASLSSLDEVAWGMAWPDFLRAAFPWGFGWTIGRGTALERAWSRNCAADPRKDRRLILPLSEWRAAATGSRSVPAIIMNATVVESGNRLLMGTSALEPSLAPEGREDASEVNRIGDRVMDVSVVTAARLSATFTWVTPAARANVDSHKPHLVDGGYYDDYGMATLVEWLDEALQGAGDGVKKVLVLQLRCAPLNEPVTPQYRTSSRGWFFQAIAPIKALIEVRSAGQVAHNDIEFALLKDKWRGRVDVQTVTFEFPGKEPPLSWHLTEQQREAIRQAWTGQMGEPIRQVEDFLAPVRMPEKVEA